MKALLTLSILLLLCTLSHSYRKPKTFPWSQIKSRPLQSSEAAPYQQLYYTQKVSHFNFKLAGQTWQQRYLLDLNNWSTSNKGPIIMYCGNEGPIEMFYNNAGWYNNYVSKQLNALLVYPESRYFGKSWPFGDQKRSTAPQNLTYLTTDQILMDYVQFIYFLKKTYCSDCPVIVFGGSYGGMLATWMRMKYPHVVDIAHAASAPIYYYKNRQDFDIGVFYQLVTKNYQMHNANCPAVIQQAFKRILAYSTNPKAPVQNLGKWFNTCKPIKNYQDLPILMQYIDTAYSYMAMINYPYPTSFLKSVPAWPANSSCIPLDNVTKQSNDQQLFSAIRKSIEYFYSYNKTQCNDIYGDGSASDQDMSGWDILACGDQAMPMKTDGVKDMFYPSQFDYDAYSNQCWDTFKIRPDYDYTLNHFGGITDKEYLSASRIVFTNGGLDPWSGASPVKALSSSLRTCFIPYGAHHLDLRPPHAADPQDVIICRSYVLNSLSEWILEIKNQKKAAASAKANLITQ